MLPGSQSRFQCFISVLITDSSPVLLSGTWTQTLQATEAIWAATRVNVIALLWSHVIGSLKSATIQNRAKCPKAKRSKAGLYFTRNADSSTATCKRCLTIFAGKEGNTSNLMKHLRRHRIQHISTVGAPDPDDVETTDDANSVTTIK